MTELLIYIAAGITGLAFILALYRFMRGPAAVDRVVDAGKFIDGLRGKHDEVMAAAVIAAFPEANSGDDAPGK